VLNINAGYFANNDHKTAYENYPLPNLKYTLGVNSMGEKQQYEKV